MEYTYSDYDSMSTYSDESGLEIPSPQSLVKPRLRPNSHTSSERTDSYRFSMANLEETHEAELDAILGELSILEQRGADMREGRTHSRTNSIISAVTNTTISTISSSSESSGCGGSVQDGINRDPRTDSPDNDSAFSDTVSLLSSESSSSSFMGSGNNKNIPNIQSNQILQQQTDEAKAAKIHLALQKLEQASVRRLFVKAFSADGASKSLLVDERMSCGHVSRLLADKNHVPMEPHWALVEHLPDLQMERLFEDHELLVDNLMLWSRDSKNRVLFLQRPDKVSLYNTPEKYLPGTQMAPGNDHDEHTRAMLLDEFFTTGGQIAMEGPLYMKSDTKKGWKRYNFVLRASGLYYFPKEKTKSSKDLLCLALFTGHDIYKGLGWKKKHKAPTDFTFALRCPKAPPSSKGLRAIKMLCAEDAEMLELWVTAIRVAKYGKKLLDNHRVLLEDLAREEIEKLSTARSGSLGSIISSVPSQCSTGSSSITNDIASTISSSSNGRLSRASSSSSSGCLSDDNNGFDSEFPTGTIKRKPSMKPNLPLTSMTRQLKEVGETTRPHTDASPMSPERGGTLTRRHSRRRSEESNGSGTLKRRIPTTNRGSIESMNSSNSSTPTPTPTTPGTPTSTNIQWNNSINNNSNAKVNSPLDIMPSCMTDSTFSLPPPPEDMGQMSLSGSSLSLDSLPPPPPPCELENHFNGSQISLVSLPPPPPPQDMKPLATTMTITNANNNNNNNIIINNNNNNTILLTHKTMPIANQTIQEMPNKPVVYSHTLPATPNNNKLDTQQIYAAKTLKPASALKAPPYKAPPPYNNGVENGNGEYGIISAMAPTPVKSVSFADSPVLLRRKVCFSDQIQEVPLSPKRVSRESNSLPPPPPPPRAEATRITSLMSPKRLQESISNPPRDFLKDLQRVMRKKWQVAQKCKQEPATTPHEVLGFRDLNEQHSQQQQSSFYREQSNVSNWVQEHYGSDCLYENLGTNMGLEPIYPPTIMSNMIKKRPPPPPPKRSEKTHLTTTQQLAQQQRLH